MSEYTGPWGYLADVESDIEAEEAYRESCRFQGPREEEEELGITAPLKENAMKKIDELKLAIDALLLQGYSYSAEVLYFKLRELEAKKEDTTC
ncbi:hypothetical protein [Paenibacillus sp. FSL R7-0333]|uniref:hypothetical protein n=1 Tax=Paenibacillus sp. FSL R7-0333 TaxID=1926587 RepID=UPI00096C69E1|nr:hypothetical protein BK146_16780 [Paenibacillus sp. FSL R7-0333]